KFFVWGRKIEDEVFWHEDMGHSVEEIIEYLEKCAELRKEYLDPHNLSRIEYYYTNKIHRLFEKYQVSDPIYDAARLEWGIFGEPEFIDPGL
ncbi:unnamed protein product, partial [marine sediment metagenome]